MATSRANRSPSIWDDFSLANPAPNFPVSGRLLDFVKRMEYDLRPLPEHDCELADIAGALRKDEEFRLRLPITAAKITTFMDVVKIVLEENKPDTAFIYNALMARYEIHTRHCPPHEWQVEVWHEFWEILFWACYHNIPGWKVWAQRKGYFRPHDTADEFAFQIALPAQSVSRKAANSCYDLWAISQHYQVPARWALRALQQYTHFPHPILFATVHLEMPSVSKNPLLGGLFRDDVVCAEVRKIFKSVKIDAFSPENPDELQSWQAVKILDEMLVTRGKHSRTEAGNILLEFSSDDAVCFDTSQADQSTVVCHKDGSVVFFTARMLFGLQLPSPVNVIVRQSPFNVKEQFLQIVPCGCSDSFLPSSNPYHHSSQNNWSSQFTEMQPQFAHKHFLSAVSAGAQLDEEEDPF